AAHPHLHSFPTRRSSDLHGPRRQPARVRGRLAIAHAGVRERCGQLRRTRVRGHDLLEVPGEADGRLTAARSAVPRHVTTGRAVRSEEHTSELQSLAYLVC